MKRIFTTLLLLTIFLTVKSETIYDLKPVGYINDYADVLDQTFEDNMNKMLSDTDAYSSRIGREYLVPFLKEKDYHSAVYSGVKRIVRFVGAEGRDIELVKEEKRQAKILADKKRAEQRVETKETVKTFFFVSLIAILIFLIIFLVYKYVKQFLKLKEGRKERISNIKQKLEDYSKTIYSIQQHHSIKSNKELREGKIDIDKNLETYIEGTKKQLKFYEKLLKKSSTFLNKCKQFHHNVTCLEKYRKEAEELELGSHTHIQLKGLYEKVQNGKNDIPTTFDFDKLDLYPNLIQQISISVGSKTTDYINLVEKLQNIESTIKSHNANKKMVNKMTNNSIKLSSDIKALGYNANHLEINKRIDVELEDQMKKIKDSLSGDISTTSALTLIYTSIINSTRSIENNLKSTKSDILSAKNFVRKFNSSYLWENLASLEKYKKYTREIAKLKKRILLVENEVTKTTDSLGMEKNIKSLGDDINGELIRARRKKRDEEEEVKRKKRQKEEEERRRRRRSSSAVYGGYSSSSSSSSSSSFGGGSFGGGGAGGGW